MSFFGTKSMEASYRVKLDPPKLTFCGFPVHQDAFTFTSKEKLERALSCVEYCQHGEMCSDCCFIYIGRVNHRKNKLGEKFNYRISQKNCNSKGVGPILHRYFFDVVFGKVADLLVRRACADDKLCVNLQHMKIYYRPIDNSLNFWDKLNICCHGRLCKKCCWSTTIKHEAKELNFHGHYSNRKLRLGIPRILYCITHNKLLAKGMRVSNVCRNKLCANLTHYVVVSKIDYGRTIIALAQAKRRSNELYEKCKPDYIKYREELPHAA